MDARRFLSKFWQRRPLLIRGAFPGIRTLLGKKELLALARSADVESRLVMERGGEYPWQVLHGPFSRARLRALPAAHWSLLVQGVNFHLAGGAQLLHHFSFIPNWRVDDLMASLAPDGGSVGAHVDSYDVFLLQVSGRRRWRINTRRYRESDFVPGRDLRILRDFRHTREWLLEPGDMLYLPPGVAHHGVAVGNSVTCSIGFRAPSGTELISALLDSGQATEQRLTDPALPWQEHAGEITRGQLRTLRTLVRRALPGDSRMDAWLGCHLTTLPPAVPEPPRQTISFRAFTARLRRGDRLQRAARTRAAFFRAGPDMHLFVNGIEYPLPAGSGDLAARVAGPADFQASPGDRGRQRRERVLLHRLYRTGLLQFAD
jgi:50S ribosomal protein L16 3-hydroxylase